VGLREDHVIPRIDEWRVSRREAMAVGMKAIEQGVTRITISEEQFLRKSKERPGRDHQCIWTKLGVISYRRCTLNYQCDKCQFAQSLMDGNGKYAQTPETFSAIERLRSLPAWQRKCRYMLMGEVSYKLCPNSYQCGSCEHDQMLQDSIYGHPKVLARMVKTKRINAQMIRRAGNGTKTLVAQMLMPMAD
jgi:hypothetical protein